MLMRHHPLEGPRFFEHQNTNYSCEVVPAGLLSQTAFVSESYSQATFTQEMLSILMQNALPGCKRRARTQLFVAPATS